MVSKTMATCHISVPRHGKLKSFPSDFRGHSKRPMYAMSHRTMQVVGEPINFNKISFALRIVAPNSPLGHRIKLSIFPRLKSL